MHGPNRAWVRLYVPTRLRTMGASMSSLILPRSLQATPGMPEEPPPTPKEPRRHWDRLGAQRGAVMWGYRDLMALSRIAKVQAEVGGSRVDGFMVSVITRAKRQPTHQQVDRVREDFDMQDADIVSLPGSDAVLVILPVEKWRQRLRTPHKLVMG